MKKIIYLALIASMLACADGKKEVPVVAKPKQNDCANNPTMKLLDKMNYSDRAVWLSHHGKIICDEKLYSCIEEDHRVSKEEFDSLALRHATNQSGNIKTYPKKWEELKEYIDGTGIQCYEKYIGFKITNGDVEFSTLPFTKKETCFSVPLFRGIAELHPDADEVSFTQAMIEIRDKKGIEKAMDKVIFMVSEKGKLYYYDISDNPKKKKKSLPSHSDL